MKIRTLAILCGLTLLLSGCSGGGAAQTAETQASVSDADGAADLSTETVSEETVTEVPAYIPSETDKKIAKWFSACLTDGDEFTDITSYQYYARTLGLDKDHFLKPEMWEVYYNEAVVNINKDIDNTEIYLIRLNPYVLLDIYAENNGTTVDELCNSLSVTKEQLYYNWGYNPASVNYAENHKKNNVTYSKKETDIFGKYNGENRDTVMSTHLLMYDGKKGVVTYKGAMTDTLSIQRRDMLGAFSEKVELYSEFTEAEKSPAFKVNGIGIRTVIPFDMPNAIARAANSSLGDADVSVMINFSPYSYGCTDDDKLDIVGIIQLLNEK